MAITEQNKNEPVIKMYAIFCRETLKQMKFEGKLAAQAGHAYLHAWWDAEDRLVSHHSLSPEIEHPLTLSYFEDCMYRYRANGDARKVSLVVDTVDELEALYYEFRPHMGATIVDDCGYTVFDVTTTTAVGLGPIQDAWVKGTRLSSLPTLKNEIERAT